MDSRPTLVLLPTVAERSDLILRLAIAADGHAPTVAGVLGVTAHSVNVRLAGRTVRARWFRARAARREAEIRALALRAWWRRRLAGMGIDPHALPVTDPLWPACHRRPRGALVRDVAAAMRREHPGEPLATDARIVELLDRVAALAALDTAAQAEAVAALAAVPSTLPPSTK